MAARSLTPRMRLPAMGGARPAVAILVRLALALLLVLLNWGLVVLERGDYTDSSDGHVSVIDALYYTTVTLSTTGYGDITPVAERARLLNALLITPMRLLFLVILVGTTLSALTQRSRDEFRLARWRATVKDHVVVLGYGTKGRNAVRELLLKGVPKSHIVVVDTDAAVIADATLQGLHGITGSAVAPATHTEAMVDRARVVIIALSRDDTAVLATLSVRRVNPTVTVVASVRASENSGLLVQSGATSVVVSSETTGRLLGLAADSPEAVAVVEDLVQFGTGLDLLDRRVGEAEVGRVPGSLDVPVIAVIRGGRTLRFNDPAIGPLQVGDRLIFVRSEPVGE